MACRIRDDKELITLVLYDFKILEFCRLLVPFPYHNFRLIWDEEGDIDVLDIGYSNEFLLKDLQIILDLLLEVIWMASSV